ncbi:MAG: BamA/TamA family outer membrane protein [Rikenellaceae bacterium]
MQRAILILTIALLLYGCSATRYVPEGESLLRRNKLEITKPKKATLDKAALEEYIQQSPNRRLLGVGLYLGFYNITDSSKHDGWHNFWGKKIGEAPVILDSSKVASSSNMMRIYLESVGFLNAELSDTIAVNKKRKATVTYKIDTKEPFRFGKITYDIKDDFLAPIIEEDTINSLLKTNGVFERKKLEGERKRITENLRNQGFWGFNQNYITYVADSMKGNSTVDLRIEIAQLTVGQDSEGKPQYANHPIYRIKDITLNSNYDATLSQEDAANNVYDTTHYNGVDILYREKLLMKSDVLLAQLGMSPGEIYDQQSIEQTYTNIRSLGFNSTILFTPLPVDTANVVYVTTFDSEAQTTQRELSCLLQCTPTVRQSFSVDFETSTTESYLSLALQLGYSNRNAFKGGEKFTVTGRGAYEFLWNTDERNSFEFGISTSLEIPRFLLPISDDKMRQFSNSSTKLTLSYNIQRRPDYQRSIVSAVFGYGWTMKNGARFTISPADINVIDVPWIDSTFLADIENPYLSNSYQSQLIAGLSASYYYNTNSDTKQDGFTFRAQGDINGNLLYGLSSLFESSLYGDEDDQYYQLFGLRYAQYVRMMAEVSNRINVGRHSQIAWRILAAGGYAYGNSKVIPFERQYYAGGSNSMRGWQVRTLGPGGVELDLSDEDYPYQLGDLRLEANFEYRVNVVGGLNLALFMDCGNIWMNGEGEDREEAKFRFDTFYTQLGLNTGLGFRYDLNFFLLRLDWGIKLHNPNNATKKWFGDLDIEDTALHFAIGLPF